MTTPHHCSVECKFKQISRNPPTFVCPISGCVHVCDETCTLRSHNRDATLVCPISGRCFEQTMNMNLFKRSKRLEFSSVNQLKQHHLPTRTQKSSRTKSTTTSFNATMVRNLLTLLLVSKKREQVDDERVRHQMKKSRRGLRRPVPKFDPLRWDYYVSTVKSMWDLTNSMLKPPDTTLSIESCTLGTIYLLQYGLCHDGKQVLPKDTYLFVHLPPVTDLVKLKVSKKRIRVGKNRILKCLRESIDEFTPIQEFGAV